MLPLFYGPPSKRRDILLCTMLLRCHFLILRKDNWRMFGPSNFKPVQVHVYSGPGDCGTNCWINSRNCQSMDPEFNSISKSWKVDDSPYWYLNHKLNKVLTSASLLTTKSPIWAFPSLKIATVMWCMTWVFHWAEYTKVKASLKYRETIACTKLTTIKVWGINTTHLKILHALKGLPNTTRI